MCSIGFPRKEQTNWLSNTKLSSLKAYIELISNREACILYLEIYKHTHTHMYAKMINEKKPWM